MVFHRQGLLTPVSPGFHGLIRVFQTADVPTQDSAIHECTFHSVLLVEGYHGCSQFAAIPYYVVRHGPTPTGGALSHARV